MADNRSAPLVTAALVMACLAVAGAAEDNITVIKEVDHLLAPPSTVITYTIFVINSGNPAVSTGLFEDYFSDQVTGCSWACFAAQPAWCEIAGGSGDIYLLVSVPVGTSARIDASCTFDPSPGFECADNVADFFTMDPDTHNQGFATTCDSNVIIFFDGFESGDLSGW